LIDNCNSNYVPSNKNKTMATRRNSAFDRDSWVFFPDKKGDKAWLPARVASQNDSTTTLEFQSGGREEISSAEFSKHEMCGASMNLDLDNLVDLDAFSEGSILHHVRKRFLEDKIYTHVGSILVALNPFQRLPGIYDDSQIKYYTANVHSSDPPAPHVYGSAALAYDQMRTGRGNQSVLVSGESGAGKTETAKQVLR